VSEVSGEAEPEKLQVDLEADLDYNFFSGDL